MPAAVAIDTRSAHDRPFAMLTGMSMAVCHVDWHVNGCDMSMLNVDSQKCTWSRCTYQFCKCQPLLNIRKLFLPLLTKTHLFMAMGRVYHDRGDIDRSVTVA